MKGRKEGRIVETKVSEREVVGLEGFEKKLSRSLRSSS